MELLILMLLPAFAGALLWALKKSRGLSLLTAAAACCANVVCAARVYQNGLSVRLPVALYGFELSFRGDRTAALFLLALAVLFTLAVVHALRQRGGKPGGGLNAFYLFLSLSMANGALLADHLGLLLFFWEGLLCTLFGMLLLGNHEAPGAAVKGLTMAGISDLTLMLGMAATAYAAETGSMSAIAERPLAVSGVGALGCGCMLLGALGKTGCLFVHSWIPHAGADARPGFQPAVPGLLYPLLGGYLSVRVAGSLFAFAPGSALSSLFLALGLVTLLGGALMALAQDDRMQALSWVLISQMGWAALGIASGRPAGLLGAMLQFLFAALCMSGLLMAAEGAHGGKLRGLLTASTWLLALSAAGFPGTAGFWAQSLILAAIKEAGLGWALAALLGAALTALALLRIVRGLPSAGAEAGGARLSPALLSAALSVAAVFSMGPLLRAAAGALGLALPGFSWGWAAALLLCAALAAADHLYGCRKGGSPGKAVEHLRALPVLKPFFRLANKGILDPYFWLSASVAFFSLICRKVEDGVCWIYDKGVPGAVAAVGDALSRFDNGRLSRYLMLAVCGAAAVGLIFVLMLS